MAEDVTIELRQQVAQHTAQIEGVQNEISSLARAMHSFVDRLESKIDRIGTPKLGVMAAWATVLIIVVGGVAGMIGAGYVRDLNRVEAQVTLMQAADTEHRKEMGHLPMQYRVEALEKDIEQLQELMEVKLQLVEARLPGKMLMPFMFSGPPVSKDTFP